MYFALMESLGKRAKAAKRTVFKTVFDSPLLQWPRVEGESLGRELLAQSIAELARFSPSLTRSPPRPRSKRPRPRPSTETGTPAREGPLVIGINQVTRALEAHKLGAVLACRDDLPFGQLLHHIPFQCRLAGCLAVPLPRGSAVELASLFNLPRVTVVGVRKDHPEVDKYLQFLRSKLPPQDMDLSQYQALRIHRIPVVSSSRVKSKGSKRRSAA